MSGERAQRLPTTGPFRVWNCCSGHTTAAERLSPTLMMRSLRLCGVVSSYPRCKLGFGDLTLRIIPDVMAGRRWASLGRSRGNRVRCPGVEERGDQRVRGLELASA
jgi:hypothetical protein